MGGILSVSTEHATISETSIKSSYNSTGVSLDGVYIISNDDINKKLLVSFEGYSESDVIVYLMVRDSNMVATRITSAILPGGISSNIVLTLNEISTDTYLVFFRLTHDNTDSIYISNVIINVL